MPRLHGKRERRHQPFFDHLIRTTGTPSPVLNQQSGLFGNANIGSAALTNMQTAGQLASDQTYIILALRAWLFFDGTNRRANYLGVANQLYFTLSLGDKAQFLAPAWYFPAGGGVWGYDSGTSFMNNGLPTQEAILKLAKPITIPVRQNIDVQAVFHAIGSTDIRTTLNTGAGDDQKVIAFIIDGVQTRDVQ